MDRRLVDTSVWIAFFSGRPEGRPLVQWILEDLLVLHPFVEGELRLGGLSYKNTTLLGSLSRCEVVEHSRVLDLIEKAKLRNSGIGWVDLHLLAAAREKGLDLITLDHSLAAQWKRLARVM